MRPIEKRPDLAEMSERPTASVPFRPLLLFTVLLAVTLRLYLMWATQRTLEDFYITLRYAENLARGQGFVYNPGERTLGTTTPLYTLFLALTARLGLDPVLCGKLLNIAAAGVAVWLVYRLGRCAGRPFASLLAAGMLAIWRADLAYSISGMETACATTLGLGVLMAQIERRQRIMAACAAALVLLRIDGLLLAGVVFGASLLQPASRSAATRAFALFLALLAPWILFATWYFGSPIPTSFVAKLTVYAWYNPSLFPNLGPFAAQMFGSALHALLLPFALAGLWRAATRLPELRPALLWMLLYYAGMAFSKAHLFAWYYLPPNAVYLLLVALGMEWGIEALNLPALKRPMPVLAAILLTGLLALPRIRAQIARDQRLEAALSRPVILALRQRVRPNERVMLEPLGYIGYFSGVRVLDAVGLVSPEVIPYFRRGAVSPYLDILAERKPDYVLLVTREYFDTVSAPVPPERALYAHYALVQTCPDPGGKLGGLPAFYLLQRKTETILPAPARRGTR